VGPNIRLALLDGQFGSIGAELQGVMSQKSLKNGLFERLLGFSPQME
jgi:hypothetical protein